MARKYLLTTLGCKVNQYESQQLRETLESAGFEPAGESDHPDVALVNTCAVTGSASRKSRQAVRRVSRKGRIPVIVVGCGASADADRLRGVDGVIAVLGHDVDVCSAVRRLLTHRESDAAADERAGQHERPLGTAQFVDLRIANSGPATAAQSSVATDPPHSGPGDRRSQSTLEQSPDVRRYEEWMKPAGSPPGYAASTSQTAKLPTNHMAVALPVVKDSRSFVARIHSFAGHQRAFLKVQDGCDAYCSYCIIPRLRPSPRSKPIDVAVAEAKDLVRAGHKEIILTGVFLGAYGRETALRRRWKNTGSPLAVLVQSLARIEGLERLRLSSLEPGDVDDALLETLASFTCCVPHLHLPLQSGSERILNRMNRQYTVEAYLDMIDRVRRVLDEPAISTDIIVGFPGERESDFEGSLEVARSAEFCKIHAFPFSAREKTAAARWRREFVGGEVARERMQRLLEVETECSLRYRQRLIGRVERVIVEDAAETKAGVGRDPVGDGAVACGRTDRYFMAHFAGNGLCPGDVVSVRIDRVMPNRTTGTRMCRSDPEATVSRPDSKTDAVATFVAPSVVAARPRSVVTPLPLRDEPGSGQPERG